MPFFKFRRGDASSHFFAGATAQVESVESLRKRARQRLIGASVLMLLGVVGFPLLFDAPPRPISVDIPIEIPSKNNVKPLNPPAATAKTGAAASALPKEEDSFAKSLAAQAASAMPTGKGHIVVQIGAFSDAAKADEARMKLEKAGFKTYTQMVDTKEGKRIRVRVGPFVTKAEAEKVAGKIKALELSASLLTL